MLVARPDNCMLPMLARTPPKPSRSRGSDDEDDSGSAKKKKRKKGQDSEETPASPQKVKPMLKVKGAIGVLCV